MSVEKKIEELIEKISNLEKRLSKIEGEPTIIKKSKGGFQGLSGGIRLLLKNGFLNEPKSVKEIYEELAREGYHYPKRSVDKLLRVNFMKKQKLLTRIKKGKVWEYVIRK